MDERFTYILNKYKKFTESNLAFAVSPIFPVFDLGLSGYMDTYSLQKEILDFVIEKNLPGILLLVEHPPVITLGTSGKTENLLVSESFLAKKNIELVPTDRGGDITFHGPGQLIGYPVLNLGFFKKDLGHYVYCLEEIIINVLKKYSVLSERTAKHRGVFIGNKKIASIGVRAKKWVTMHGFSLNVSVNLEYFNYIVACGLKDYRQTSLLEQTGLIHDIKIVKEQILSEFSKVFIVEICRLK